MFLSWVIDSFLISDNKIYVSHPESPSALVAGMLMAKIFVLSVDIFCLLFLNFFLLKLF